MANVSLNLGDKVILDANDATNPNTTFITNPSAATNPNNVIEFQTNGAKRLELGNSNLVHSPASRPVVEFGAADGGGDSGQYRIRVPNASHRILVFGGTASPYSLAEFAVQATEVLLEGRVTIKARGSGTGTGDLEFTEVSPDIRCAGGLRVLLVVGGIAQPNNKFEVATPFQTYFAVDPAATDTIQAYGRIHFPATSAAERGIESINGDFEVHVDEDLLLHVNSKNNNPTAKVRIKTNLTEVATIDKDGMVLNVALNATAQGLRTKYGTASPSGGTAGELYVETDVNKLWVHNGSAWKSVTLT